MEICHQLSLQLHMSKYSLTISLTMFICSCIWKKNLLWWVFPWQVVKVVVGSSLGNTKMTSVSRFCQQFSARTERRRGMIPYLHMINCVSLYIFWPLGKHIHNWDMPFVCLCLQLLRLFQLRGGKFVWCTERGVHECAIPKITMVAVGLWIRVQVAVSPCSGNYWWKIHHCLSPT